MLILPKKERECMGDFIVYIRFERNNEVSEKDVTIGSIADVFCDDKTLESKVNAIKLVHIAPKVKRDRIVFSVMDVIKKINDVCPGVQIENIGEEDFVIDYIDENKPWYRGEILKFVNLIFICILTFCGSAFTIIAYDNDVDIPGIFSNLYEFFGVSGDNKLMEIMYSIGFGMGILVFYNHFCGKKITNDPSPIEVEQTAYEKEIDDALFDKAERMKEEMKKQ